MTAMLGPSSGALNLNWFEPRAMLNLNNGATSVLSAPI